MVAIGPLAFAGSSLTLRKSTGRIIPVNIEDSIAKNIERVIAKLKFGLPWIKRVTP